MFIKKKLLSIILLLFLMIYQTTCFSAPWINMDITYNGKKEKYSAENVYLYVNGKRVENLSMPPIIFNGSTLVPAREVFEPLGATVSWIKETEEVIISYKNNNLKLKINSEITTVNEKTLSLSVPARIINNKTMIPARFIAEALGLKVEWDSKTRIINIREISENITIPDFIVELEPPTISETMLETTTESTTEIHKEQETKIQEENELDNEVEENVESTTERPPVALNEPVCKDGILKISSDGILGDFANTETKSKKIIYLLTRTTLPPKDSYTFDDEYVKKVTFSQIKLNDKNVTEITVHFNKKNLTPISYIETNLKTFVVDFINDDIPNEYINPDEEDNDVLASDENVDENFDENSESIVSSLPSDKSVYFENNCLYIKKNSSFKLNLVKSTDNYTKREYIIDLGTNLSDVVKANNYDLNNTLLNSVNINHSSTTKLTISEKKVLAYDITENTNYICIKPISPKEKFDKIVVIDAGHGGDDPGAISETNNLVEEELNLSIAQKVVNLFDKNESIKVYAVRLDDVFYTRPERAELANEIGDMFISIHANSFTNETANGTEVWYYPHANDSTIGLTSQKLAETLQTKLIEKIKSANRGVKSTNYDVLTLTNIPAALCETGFITNTQEAQNLKNDNYRNLIAQAIYESIIELFKTYTPKR